MPHSQKPPLPAAKWQTGDYAPIQNFRFNIPIGFLVLCRLWDTTPRELLMDFMDNLSHGCHNRRHRAEAKQYLRHYIYEMAYGQQKYYNRRDIKQMFIELDTIGRLWPNNAGEKMTRLHAKWQEEYYHWWFKKWYTQLRRR